MYREGRGQRQDNIWLTFICFLLCPILQGVQKFVSIVLPPLTLAQVDVF